MRLHEQRNLMQKRVIEAQERILHYRNYIAGPKFQGHDTDGYPANYIYTHEVQNMLREVEDIILGMEDDNLC